MTDPSPKRDKFASMAARQQQMAEASPQPTIPAVVQPSVSAAAPAAPKRDKFASMAARQKAISPINSSAPLAPVVPAPNLGVATGATATPSTSPPKRDKFATLAARQQQAISLDVPPVTVTSPKRDKFASMAQATNNNVGGGATTTPAPKRGDKFASLKKGGGGGTSPMSPPKSSVPTDEDRMKELRKRAHQRHKVFRDLEKAEGCTWNLLQLASQTAKNLCELRVKEDDTTLSDLSSKYRDTLRKIHSLLLPHAKFVKAYQNRQEEESAPNMYAARVETRLAQERRSVIEDLLRLEKEEQGLPKVEGDDSNKRKREE